MGPGPDEGDWLKTVWTLGPRFYIKTSMGSVLVKLGRVNT